MHEQLCSRMSLLRHHVVNAGEEAVRSAFISVDQAGIGSLTEHQFEAALRQANIELSRHQIISLHRRLAKDGKVQVEDVLRVLI